MIVEKDVLYDVPDVISIGSDVVESSQRPKQLQGRKQIVKKDKGISCEISKINKFN